jgi:hypothetical protein
MKKPKVIYKKLSKARGYYYSDTHKIEIDERLQDVELLDTLIHEFTHYIQPYLDEEKVERIGNELSMFLWENGYRKQKTYGKNNVIKR